MVLVHPRQTTHRRRRPCQGMERRRPPSHPRRRVRRGARTLPVHRLYARTGTPDHHRLRRPQTRRRRPHTPSRYRRRVQAPRRRGPLRRTVRVRQGHPPRRLLRRNRALALQQRRRGLRPRRPQARHPVRHPILRLRHRQRQDGQPPMAARARREVVDRSRTPTPQGCGQRPLQRRRAPVRTRRHPRRTRHARRPPGRTRLLGMPPPRAPDALRQALAGPERRRIPRVGVLLVPNTRAYARSQPAGGQARRRLHGPDENTPQGGEADDRHTRQRTRGIGPTRLRRPLHRRPGARLHLGHVRMVALRRSRPKMEPRPRRTIPALHRGNRAGHAAPAQPRRQGGPRREKDVATR